MVILGLNAYHGDSSACIVIDGKLGAAVEEERFTRIKHWAGLPVLSVRYCLAEAGVKFDDIDHIAVNRDPKANIFRKSLYVLSKGASFDLIKNRLQNATKVKGVKPALCKELNVQFTSAKTIIHNVEHHVAHLGSAFYVSPFDHAAVVSIDGFGDFIGAMWGSAHEKKIDIRHRTYFPHSLGLFYLAFTQYLGFMNYGDEYKVMGLTAYGEPEYMDEMRMIVKTFDTQKETLFELNLDYFIHHSKGVAMMWNGGEPKMGQVFSAKLEKLLGPARKKGEPLEQKYKNIAASLQKRYEEVLFHYLNHVYEKTGSLNLALAGGCAMNSLCEWQDIQ